MASNKQVPVNYNEVFESLRSMIGKEYIYRSKRIKILEVSEVEEVKFLVQTDALPPVKVTCEKSAAFIAECYPVEDLKEVVTREVVVHEVKTVEVPVETPYQLKSVNQEELVELSQGLLAQFRKIKNKPTKENIDAGNAMQGISSSVLNVAKLELQAIALASKTSKR